jgi:hypothetical protein
VYLTGACLSILLTIMVISAGVFLIVNYCIWLMSGHTRATPAKQAGVKRRAKFEKFTV